MFRPRRKPQWTVSMVTFTRSGSARPAHSWSHTPHRKARLAASVGLVIAALGSRHLGQTMPVYLGSGTRQSMPS